VNIIGRNLEIKERINEEEVKWRIKEKVRAEGRFK